MKRAKASSPSLASLRVRPSEILAAFFGSAVAFSVSTAVLLGTLLLRGVHWVEALAGSAIVGLVATVFGPAMNARLQDRRERKKAHLAYIVQKAVQPDLAELRSRSGGNVGDYLASYAGVMGLLRDVAPIHVLPTGQVQDWLDAHEPRIKRLRKEYHDRDAALYRAFFDARAAVAAEARRQTGYRDPAPDEEVKRGEVLFEQVAQQLLRARARDEERHRTDFKETIRGTRSDPPTDTTWVSWDTMQIAALPTGEVSRFIAAVKDLHGSQVLQDGLRAIRAALAAREETRRALMQALEVVESEGGPRGSCPRCRFRLGEE